MYIISVIAYIKPSRIQEFIDLTLDNARNARLEPGNVRFDVAQAEDEPERFLLYEAYKTKDDFVKHQQTDHYLRWKQTAPDCLSRPRDSMRHQALFFDDGEA